MSTGLFFYRQTEAGRRPSQKRLVQDTPAEFAAHNEHRKAVFSANVDAFAEALANSSLKDGLETVARRLGIPGSTARGYMRYIQRGLGDQAR